MITLHLSRPDTKANLRKLVKSNNAQQKESLKAKTLRADRLSLLVTTFFNEM